MQTKARLCSRCAHPYAFDDRPSRAEPPSSIHGEVATQAMRCTRCDDEILEGCGYFVIETSGNDETSNSPPDALSVNRNKRADRSGLPVEATITLLGLILAAAPLAIWLAPTIQSFLLVLLVTASAVGGLCIIDHLQGGAQLFKRLRTLPPVRGLSDRYIAELLKLLPMTHHNRRPGDPEFQRKMDRLKSIPDC